VKKDLATRDAELEQARTELETVLKETREQLSRAAKTVEDSRVQRDQALGQLNELRSKVSSLESEIKRLREMYEKQIAELRERLLVYEVGMDHFTLSEAFDFAAAESKASSAGGTVGRELVESRRRYDALMATMNGNGASIGVVVELHGVLETARTLRRRLDESNP